MATYQDIVNRLYEMLDNKKLRQGWIKNSGSSGQWGLVHAALHHCELEHYGLRYDVLLLMPEVNEACKEDLTPDEIVQAAKWESSPLDVLDHRITRHFIAIGNAYLTEKEKMP